MRRGDSKKTQSFIVQQYKRNNHFTLNSDYFENLTGPNDIVIMTIEGQDIISCLKLSYASNRKESEDHGILSRTSDIDLSIPELDEHSNDHVTPKIVKNPSETINRIVRNFKELLAIEKRLVKDFQTGGLNENCYSIIERQVEDSKSRLRTGLTQFINETNSIRKDVDEETGRAYFTAGMLNREDYEWLAGKYWS
jgi:hypothetical protein